MMMTMTRSTSLKTAKTPPTSPRQKKIVRFADTLGLDLEAVKTIMQEDLPFIPDSAFSYLDIHDQPDTGKSYSFPTNTHPFLVNLPFKFGRDSTSAGATLNHDDEEADPWFRKPSSHGYFNLKLTHNNNMSTQSSLFSRRRSPQEQASPVDRNNNNSNNNQGCHNCNQMGTTKAPRTPIIPNWSSLYAPQGPNSSKLVAEFIDPFVQLNFIDRVKGQNVCLENCYISANTMCPTPDSANLTTCVRVTNRSFDKEITLRYTVDEWASFQDLILSYIPTSSDSWSDRFTTNFTVSNLKPGQKVQFCIRFKAGTEEFWDNNMGHNYTLVYKV